MDVPSLYSSFAIFSSNHIKKNHFVHHSNLLQSILQSLLKLSSFVCLLKKTCGKLFNDVAHPSVKRSLENFNDKHTEEKLFFVIR